MREKRPCTKGSRAWLVALWQARLRAPRLMARRPAWRLNAHRPSLMADRTKRSSRLQAPGRGYMISAAGTTLERGWINAGKRTERARARGLRRARLDHRRDPQPRGVQDRRRRHRAAAGDRGVAPQAAADPSRVRGAEPGGRGTAERDRGRHLVRLRLSGRRAAAVRGEGTGGELHPRLPGPAADRGGECADRASHLLAHPAADRPRLRHHPRTHAQRRQCGRPGRSGKSSSAWSRRRSSSGPTWRD